MTYLPLRGLYHNISARGRVDICLVLTVNFRQPSHEFTFNVGIDLLSNH
jgi:hypothetical protein